MRNSVEVHRVVKSVKRRGQYIESHSHVFFHYIYALRGHTQVKVDGVVYQTEPGSLTLLPPGAIHDIVSLDTSCCLDLKFSCSKELEARLSKLPRYLRSVAQRATDLIRNIFEEAVGQERDYDEMINIRLYELLILLLREKEGGERTWLQTGSGMAAQFGEPLSCALRSVEENLTRPIRVAELAECCRYSENYFRQIFRTCVGISPNAYVNRRKIARAKELMLYSELNVSQIAETLGYQSVHYFSRLFKKTVGITPSDYVRRIKEDRPINILHNANTPEGEFELPVRDSSAEFLPPDAMHMREQC